MAINYEQQTYQDYPSTASPVNSARLNHSEAGIKGACDRVDAIGTVYSGAITSVPSVSGWTQLYSITVPNGVYVVTGSLEYSGTISSRVLLGVGNSEQDNQTGYNGINGGYTLRNTVIVAVTAGSIKLGCYCVSAFTPDKAAITAVRIA